MSALDDAHREIWGLKKRLDSLQPLLALLFADYARREPAKFNDLRELFNYPGPVGGPGLTDFQPDCRAIFADAADMAKMAAEKEVAALNKPLGEFDEE